MLGRNCNRKRFENWRGSGFLALTLKRSRNLKYNTKVSIEDVHPLSCKTDVTGWPSFKVIFSCLRYSFFIFLERGKTIFIWIVKQALLQFLVCALACANCKCACGLDYLKIFYFKVFFKKTPT